MSACGDDKKKLEALIEFSRKVERAADERLVEVRLAVKTCSSCDAEEGEAGDTKHCSEKNCLAALCEDCRTECGCGSVLCGDHERGVCEGLCRETLCEECVFKPRCGREVFICENCWEDYDCEDCDMCMGYY